MSDVSTSGRVEPVMDAPQEGFYPPASSPSPATPAPLPVATPVRDSSASSDRAMLEQLSRIEDKTARIEDKYARTESLLLRVEDKVETTSTRTNELPTQADLNALSNRVSSLPGYGALLFTAIIAGIVAAALTYAVLRFGVPGVGVPPLMSASATATPRPGAMPTPPPPAAPAVVPR